jgi:hypothetical protein
LYKLDVHVLYVVLETLRKSRTQEYLFFFALEHHWDSQIISFDHQSKEKKKPHAVSLRPKKAACGFAQRLYCHHPLQ